MDLDRAEQFLAGDGALGGGGGTGPGLDDSLCECPKGIDLDDEAQGLTWWRMTAGVTADFYSKEVRAGAEGGGGQQGKPGRGPALRGV